MNQCRLGCEPIDHALGLGDTQRGTLRMLIVERCGGREEGVRIRFSCLVEFRNQDLRRRPSGQ